MKFFILFIKILIIFLLSSEITYQMNVYKNSKNDLSKMVLKSFSENLNRVKVLKTLITNNISKNSADSKEGIMKMHVSYIIIY